MGLTILIDNSNFHNEDQINNKITIENVQIKIQQISNSYYIIIIIIIIDIINIYPLSQIESLMKNKYIIIIIIYYILTAYILYYIKVNIFEKEIIKDFNLFINSEDKCYIKNRNEFINYILVYRLITLLIIFIMMMIYWN